MSPDLYPRFVFFAYDTLSRSLMKRLNQFHKLFICLKIHVVYIIRIFASLRLCRHTVLTLGIPLFSNIKMIASGYVNKPTYCTVLYFSWLFLVREKPSEFTATIVSPLALPYQPLRWHSVRVVNVALTPWQRSRRLAVAMST